MSPELILQGFRNADNEIICIVISLAQCKNDEIQTSCSEINLLLILRFLLMKMMASTIG